jgi:septal ring factor EnvC (AmiA/AmiB activator)
MSVGERVIKLEEFAADVRKYTQILTEMIRRHDERIDDHQAQMAELRAAHAETERGIAALTNAQIRTEDSLKKLFERDERRGENGNGQS